MTRRTRTDDTPVLPPTDDVARVIALLEWARCRGYRIGPTLQVGGVIMNVEDLRLAKVEGSGDVDPHEPDVYEAAGLAADDVPAEGTSG